MNDGRELLELAAKAAGIYWDRNLEVWYSNDHVRSDWNPLTDDSDALRLAVKLGLQVITAGRRIAQAIEYESGAYGECEKDADPYAATRRAIVRAAAEIGRNMS